MFSDIKLKYFIVSLMFLYSVNNLFAQIGYVPADDEIYLFLNRMQTLDIIEDYNSFEIPKTRKQIANYLFEIISRINELDKIDKLKLNDFVSEFEYDLFGSNKNSLSLFCKKNPKYILSDKEKYLYYFSDTNKTNIYINALLGFNSLNEYNSNENRNSFLYKFGGEIRGSLFNKIGFYAKVTNGSFGGNKNLITKFHSLKYNYKINNETGSKIGDNFFDETEAFFTLDYDYAKIKIGNDRNIIGYGAHKIFLSNNAPRMDYLALNLEYESLQFTFMHGKLLGLKFHKFDNSLKNYTEVFDKYFVYHRLQISPFKNFVFGLGEMLIYANRNMDFSYLNPFNFYKSAEHLNQDRDNSMMFLDFQNNSFPRLKLYATLLLDDLDFGKIGTGWYGNKTLWNVGIYSNLLYKYLPLDFELQYIRIEPYVFTHRIASNNFTSLNYSLGATLPPNSSNVIFNIYYRPYYRINMNLKFIYSKHAGNLYNANGNLIKNYGGNISDGHRLGDSEKIHFLEGIKETTRIISFFTDYEPKKNIILSLNANYTNKLLSTSQFNERLFINLALKLKF